MEASDEPDLPDGPTIEFAVPEEIESGSYANVLSVWHTPHEFTLDFSVTSPPQPNAAGEAVIPAQVVARLKIAPSLVFDVLQALNENMTRYEQAYGEIKRPSEGEDAE